MVKIGKKNFFQQIFCFFLLVINKYTFMIKYYSLSLIFVLLPLPSRYRLEVNVPHRSSTLPIVPQRDIPLPTVTYRYSTLLQRYFKVTSKLLQRYFNVISALLQRYFSVTSALLQRYFNVTHRYFNEVMQVIK